MRIIAPFCLAFCLLWPTTFFAQDTYQHDDGEEIPLDDFPKFALGYRIQLGAFSSESLALAMIDSLASQIDQRIHMNYADSFWKVRIGDFDDSSAAERYLKTKLWPLGYYDAEIIEDKVPIIGSTAPGGIKVDGFRLQVKALSDRDQALELGRTLDFNYPDIRIYVIYRDGLFKVQLGDFRTREESETWLEKLRDLPDLDAWIVPTKVYLNPLPSPLERPVVDPFKYDD